VNSETNDQPHYDNHGATLAPTDPIPSMPPSSLRKIFIGKDGIRAGWSLLIFIAIFAAIALWMNFVVHKLFPSVPKTMTPLRAPARTTGDDPARS
jgi:hypothetical protein